MKRAIKILSAASMAAFAAQVASAAVPVVTTVAMEQPNNSREVTITYTLAEASAVVTLEVQTNANTSAAADDPSWTSIGGAAVCNAQGDVWKQVATGNHTITWRPDLSWPGHKIQNGGARAVVTAWSLDNTPDYMAVDVSEAAKANSQTYYPAADFVPGGVTNSLYKTTTLLMRKIMAKDVKWTMGSTTLETQRETAREATHQVTLANNYYIGVYEVTQSQWSQVATNSGAAAYFTADRSMRPMEKVSFREIRNTYSTSSTAEHIYGGTVAVDPVPSSFLGLLRLKTGIDFDLPSEAQWEFAARSGNGVGCWNDGSSIANEPLDANLNALARYLNNPSSNSTTTPGAAIVPGDGGTAIVGSYKPSDWGLYDMHGNVSEWCLDWWEVNIATAKDASGNDYGGRVNINPANPAQCLSGGESSTRLIRGGNWRFGSAFCRPACRVSNAPTIRQDSVGFRVVCTAGLQ